jgi:transposase InsO family protein
MHELGLESIRVHSKKDYFALHGKNKLKRQFNASAPNAIWVSDITKFKVKGIYYHVCVVIDLYSRKVVGFKISPNASTQIVTSSFRMAFNNRGCPKELLFHSDQGCQYTSRAFRRLLVKCGVDQSFSHTGSPTDNAVNESFFSNLKKEEIYRHDYRSEREFKIRVARYIENYNKNRPHSYNNYMSPDEKESQYYRSLPE